MKKLAFIMANDWNIYSKFSHEYNILCRNYAMGRKVTIAYAGKNRTENTAFFNIPRSNLD